MTAIPHPNSPGPGRHDPYAALREPNYRAFASGWALASIGLQMQGTALAWEIYERTGDPLALGTVGLARVLPVVLLALPAGQIVDLVDRLRVLKSTQFAFAAASLLLALGSYAWGRGWLGTPHQGVWAMYALVVLTGCARVFNGPSRSSLLPQIVRPEHFQNAVTWNSGVFQFSATAGPILAGSMIALSGRLGLGPVGADGRHAGVAWPVYAVTALSCLWFAVQCGFIRPYPRPEREARLPAGTSVWGTVRPRVLLPGMLEGARHVWRERTVLGALALDLFAVLLGGATALMPVYAKDILHVGPVGLGVLKAMPYVGALAMAVVMAHRPPLRRAGWALLRSVAGFGVCTVVFGVSTSFWVSIAALFVLGALDNISVVIRHVLVAVRTPDRLRGRVSAVNSVFIESSNELGAFESGLVAKLFGPVASVVSGGIGTVVVVIAMAWWLPELRRLGTLDMRDEGRREAGGEGRVGEPEASGKGEAETLV